MITLTAFDDRETDVTNVLADAMMSGESVELRGGNWVTTEKLYMPSGSTIVGAHRPSLRMGSLQAGTSAHIVMMDSCLLDGVMIDFDRDEKPYHYHYGIDVLGQDNEIANLQLSDSLSEMIRVFGRANSFKHLSLVDCNRSGIFVRGDASFNDFSDIEFEGMGHFGVHASDQSNRNTFSRLRCEQSGLELIALLEETWGCKVENCHAEGTGDNGLSIGGWGHTVVGNFAYKNAHNGIQLFGRDNVCTGNRAEANNQRVLTESWPTFAGISMTPAFGSHSRRNVVSGNWTGDLQAAPTQSYGIHCRKNAHIKWKPSEAIYGSNAYRWHESVGGLSVYKAVDFSGGALSGTTPPTHTSGIVSDGSVSWKHIFTEQSLDSAENFSTGNIAVGNVIMGFRKDCPQNILSQF